MDIGGLRSCVICPELESLKSVFSLPLPNMRSLWTGLYSANVHVPLSWVGQVPRRDHCCVLTLKSQTSPTAPRTQTRPSSSGKNSSASQQFASVFSKLGVGNCVQVCEAMSYRWTTF